MGMTTMIASPILFAISENNLTLENLFGIKFEGSSEIVVEVLGVGSLGGLKGPYIAARIRP
jgi:hypothetical protein